MFKSNSADTDLRHTTNTYLVWIVSIVLLLGTLTFAVKLFGPSTAMFNYERFFDIKREYDTRVTQIRVTKSLPSDNQTRTDLQAMVYSCTNLANTYNVDSLKFNRELFKSSQLPYQLDVGACQ